MNICISSVLTIMFHTVFLSSVEHKMRHFEEWPLMKITRERWCCAQGQRSI